MKNRIVVALTAWQRPEYTRRVIESLAAAKKPKPIYLVAGVEPGCPAVERVIEEAPFEYELAVNERRLGGPSNTLATMKRAFALADQVIKLEDDTPIAYDALYYFQWALRTYKKDASVFSVCGYNRNATAVAPGLHGSVFRHEWFTPWGWATWRDRWDSVIANWPNGQHGWDHYLNRTGRAGRVEIRSYLSRVQNIGAKKGYNCNDEAWHRTHQYSPMWVGAIAPKMVIKEWSEE